MIDNLVNYFLLSNGITDPMKFYGKIFLVSHEPKVENERLTEIYKISRLVRLDLSVIGHPFVDKLETVTEMRLRLKSNEFLLSVQALVLIKIKDESFVALLQRGANTPFDPLLWTIPGGRMASYGFSNGAIIKFLEKFRLGMGDKNLIPYYPGLLEKENLLKVHQKSWGKNSDFHEFVKVSLPPLDGKKVQIIWEETLSKLYAPSRADHGLPLIDGPNHTVEMVIPIKMELPEMPQVFGENATLVPLTTLLEPGWLEKHPATFALHTLVRQHSELLKQLAAG